MARLALLSLLALLPLAFSQDVVNMGTLTMIDGNATFTPANTATTDLGTDPSPTISITVVDGNVTGVTSLAKAEAFTVGTTVQVFAEVEGKLVAVSDVVSVTAAVALKLKLDLSKLYAGDIKLYLRVKTSITVDLFIGLFHIPFPVFKIKVDDCTFPKCQLPIIRPEFDYYHLGWLVWPKYTCYYKKTGGFLESDKDSTGKSYAAENDGTKESHPMDHPDYTHPPLEKFDPSKLLPFHPPSDYKPICKDVCMSHGASRRALLGEDASIEAHCEKECKWDSSTILLHGEYSVWCVLDGGIHFGNQEYKTSFKIDHLCVAGAHNY